MGKFHDFSITQILREINLGDCRSAKSAISKYSEALNLDFYKFFHFLMAEMYQINSEPLKMAKRVILELLESPTLISRKI